MDLDPLLHLQSGAGSVRSRSGFLAALALSLFCFSAPAAPGDVSKFPINDDNPSASIPPLEARNASPMQFGYFLQDLYTRGEVAFEKKDWATSVKYFEALAKIITDRARSFSKLCEAYQHLEKFDLARANCAKAIVLGGATLMDHRRFLELSVEAKTLTRANVADLDASIAHVREQAAAHPPAALPPRLEVKPVGQGTAPADAARVLEEIKEAQRERKEILESNATRAAFLLQYEGLVCRLGLRLRDAQRLDQCVAELKRQKADARVVITFEWAKAVVVRDRKGSLALLEQAKQLKLSDATLAAMVREHRDTFGFLALLKRYKLALGAVLAAMVILGAGLVWLRRMRRSAPSARGAAAAGEPAAS